VILRVLIVWGVIASAIALAALLHRRTAGDEEPPDYRVVLAFVGSSYGLLLGLLVVFSVGHYSDARHRAESEATSLVSLYDAVAVYPPTTRNAARHELVCYMRSIVADDWPSMEAGSSTATPRTLAFGDRLRSDLRRLPVASQRESSAYGRAANLITDAGQSRQQLLFLTDPEIPAALWLVVYVGGFLLVFLIASAYMDNPGGRVIALGSLTVLLTVVVAVLSSLDRPFAAGARVQPNQMRQAIALISTGSTPAIVLRPCRESPQG
jgi:hypothetical protein